MAPPDTGVPRGLAMGWGGRCRVCASGPTNVGFARAHIHVYRQMWALTYACRNVVVPSGHKEAPDRTCQPGDFTPHTTVETNHRAEGSNPLTYIEDPDRPTQSGQGYQSLSFCDLSMRGMRLALLSPPSFAPTPFTTYRRTANRAPCAGEVERSLLLLLCAPVWAYLLSPASTCRPSSWQPSQPYSLPCQPRTSGAWWSPSNQPGS